MTPKQWQDEFRQELEKLCEPIDRLCALITLTPKYHSPENLIKQVLANRVDIQELCDEQKNEEAARVDAVGLEKLYQMLKLLPRPVAGQNYIEKHNALSEIQLFALGQILSVCTDEDSDTDDLVSMCEHWQELLNPLENEIGYEKGLARLIAEITPNLTYGEIQRQIVNRSRRTHCTLLNAHPWNRKALKLLEDAEGISCSPGQLHILTLMFYGLDNKGERMRKVRGALEKRCGMYELEWKPAEMASWIPMHAMFYITSATDYNPSHYLPEFMEAETVLEGSIALLCHLVDLMEYRHEI